MPHAQSASPAPLLKARLFFFGPPSCVPQEFGSFWEESGVSVDGNKIRPGSRAEVKPGSKISFSNDDVVFVAARTYDRCGEGGTPLPPCSTFFLTMATAASKSGGIRVWPWRGRVLRSARPLLRSKRARTCPVALADGLARSPGPSIPPSLLPSHPLTPPSLCALSPPPPPFHACQRSHLDSKAYIDDA